MNAVYVLLAALLGFGSQMSVELVGQLIVSEMLALPAALGLLIVSPQRLFRNKEFRLFFLLALAMLLGYLMAMVIAGAPMAFVAKRLANVVFMLVSLFTLCHLFLNDRRAILAYLIASGLAAIAVSLNDRLPVTITTWKRNYAGGFSSLAIALSCLLPPLMQRGSYVLASLVHFTMNARSAAGMFLLAVGSSFAKQFTQRMRHKGFAVAAVALVLGGSLVGLVQLKKAFEELNRDKGLAYQIDSKAMRMAALQVAFETILDSPVFGHGNPEQDAVLDRKLAKKIVENYATEKGPKPDLTKDVKFIAHSKVLDAWLEGGILGALFFFVLFYRVGMAYAFALFARPADRFSTLYFYLCVHGMWHTLFSPFKGINRIGTAMTIAFLCVVWQERAMLLGAPSPSGAAPAPRNGRTPGTPLHARRSPAPSV